jgi:hypothetical protein
MLIEFVIYSNNHSHSLFVLPSKVPAFHKPEHFTCSERDMSVRYFPCETNYVFVLGKHLLSSCDS